MGYMYRCSDRHSCGVRRALKRLIEKYVYRPKCPGCKRDTLKPVYEKEYARAKRRMCFCLGNYWPHNRGYIKDSEYTCLYADEGDILAFQMHAKAVRIKPNQECPF